MKTLGRSITCTMTTQEESNMPGANIKKPAALGSAVAAALAIGWPLSAGAQNELNAQSQRGDPNAPAVVRGNSNMATPGLTDSLQSFGAAAQVAKVEVKADKADAPADSLGLIRVTVRVLNADGKPVSGQVPVLLEATRGRIVPPGKGNTALEAALDRDRTAVGTQAIVTNGDLSFDIVAPGEAGESIIRVTAGARQQSVRINFVPHLREMIAVGLVEGLIVLRDQKGALQPVRPGDGFEQEIRRFQREFGGGDGAAGVRTAFFLKGKISGATLLTAAYDSDKDVRGRLFRDIRADEFYPVYGDASLKGYDAQTSGRFYVRVDNNKSYALYGDFNTAEGNRDDTAQLSRYNRSLTGAMAHVELGPLDGTVFVSRDTLRQVVDEIAGKGISGPYTARFANGIQNTEKVEIVVRDRNAPAVILRVVPQVRFVDYDFEPFSGRILFKSPVPSLDENLNPVSIRIAYEVDEGGEKYWVGGVSAGLKIGNESRVGASYVRDENPLAEYELSGLTANVKLGANTQLQAEFARSNRGQALEYGSNSLVDINNRLGNANSVTSGPAKGDAWRAEIRHQTGTLEARGYVQRVDQDFANPSAAAVAGRAEAGIKATVRALPNLRLTGEVVRSEDLATKGQRQGASAALAWDITPAFTAELGVRKAEQTGAGASVAATAFGGTGTDTSTGGLTLSPNAALNTNLNAPYDSTSARLKLTLRPTSATSVFVEGERDLDNTDAHALAVGGDYRFSEVGRVYARSEWASGLAGSYGLAGSGRQAATVVGVDAQYMKDGSVYSEYRLRDAISGPEAVAAIGLRNYWPVAEGVRLSTNIERVKAIDGPSSPEATAAGVGLDYTANPLWRASGRLEWRDDNLSTSWLSTLAVARKLSDDWTLLGRNYAYKQTFDSGDYNRQNRLQLGLAWRDTLTSVWNVLGRYEYRTEASQLMGIAGADAIKHIVSVDVDYHRSRPVWFAGKIAGKWSDELLAGSVRDKFDAQLLQGRVIWDITNKWDLSVILSALGDSGFKNHRTGVAIEGGYILTGNLWLSAGYSFKDLREKDLLTDYSSKGPFMRLRWKFDENLLKRGQSGSDKTVEPTQ